MSVIRGENAILFFKVDGYFKPVACMVSCNLTTNTELAETSTVQSGTYRTYRGNRNTWTVSCQGIVSFDTNHPHVKLRQLQQSFTPIPISFTATDENGISETVSGKVIITSIPTDASASDFYSYSIEATGTGKYKITDIPVDPNECCQDEWYYYTGNGTEGSSIIITALIGKQIAGRIYRDGFEFRPSGADNDGTGTPVGKQFSFDTDTGALGFDVTLTGIASGEQIDIPYNICGSSAACDIEISNVMPTVNGSGLFEITFLPVANSAITPPDDVMVRYSTDGGATWTDVYNITYDPAVNYQLVTINDLLPVNTGYLFEVTPICNATAGTPGTGIYLPCVPVSITPTTLPDAYIGQPYSVDIPLTGTQPFVLNGPVGPGWMSFAVNGDHVELRGTPDAAQANVEIGFHISNCAGNYSDDLPASTIDVHAGGSLSLTYDNAGGWNPNGTNQVTGTITGIPGETISVTLTLDSSYLSAAATFTFDNGAIYSYSLTLSGTPHTSQTISITVPVSGIIDITIDGSTALGSTTYYNASLNW